MRKLLWVTLLLLTAVHPLLAQTASPRTSPLKGTVIDPLGAPMVGAAIRVLRGDEVVLEGEADNDGNFEFNLVPDEYRIVVAFDDFSTHTEVVRLTPNMDPVVVSMKLSVIATTVDVIGDDTISMSLDSSLGTTMLTGDQLQDLPDNEDDLAEYLQQLAGVRGGSESTADFVIDGFSGGRLPPRDQIQQIIIENNPFSAEGGGEGPRVRVITRPGTGDWRGGMTLTFRDESLNAQAASANNKPSSQRRNFNSQMSGPLIVGKLGLTFAGSIQESESEGNSIQANTPDNVITRGVVSPSSTKSINPRFQVFLNPRNTLNLNFNYSTTKAENQGTGGFNLPERATNRNQNSFSVQISENATIGNQWNNEVRFQMSRNRNDQLPVSDTFAINVIDSFNSGANPNSSSSENKAFQWANQIRGSVQNGRWQFNTGVQVDHYRQFNVSQNNYLGTYTFSSLHDYCVATGYVGVNCQPTKAIVEAAEAAGIPPTYTNSRGNQVTIRGVPTQFTQTSGDPAIRLSQTEFAAFMESTWRLNQKLSAQMGVRWQAQTQLSDYNNFAPRINLRYQRDAATIITGGAGIIHTQTGFSLSNYETLLRNDGTGRQNSIVINTFDPADPFGLSGTASSRNSTQIRTRDENLAYPYSFQTQVSVERRLPKQIGLTVALATNRAMRLIRNRNINAPDPETKLRPDPTRGNILQYESTANAFSRNLSFTFRQNMRIGRWQFNTNGTYTLGWSYDEGAGAFNTGGGGFNQSAGFNTGGGNQGGGFSGGGGNQGNAGGNTQGGGFNGGGGGNQGGGGVNTGGGGSGSLPSDNYNMRADWGPSNNDQRHRFQAQLNITAPWNIQIRLNPTVNSGRPYNITTGRDDNGDTTINDRPLGVTRNSGIGPTNYNLNLNFSKTFFLAAPPETQQQAAGRQPNAGGAQQGNRNAAGGNQAGGNQGNQGNQGGGNQEGFGNQGGFGGNQGGFGGNQGGFGGQQGGFGGQQGGQQGGQRQGQQGGQGGVPRPRMMFTIQVQNVLNHPQQQIRSSVLTSQYFGMLTGNSPRNITLSLQFQDLF